MEKKQAMQKCLNDIFGGYCSGTPQIGETAEVGSKDAGHWTVSTCKLNPKECGSYMPFSQVVKPVAKLGSGVKVIKAGAAKCGAKKKIKEKPAFEQGALL